MKTVPYENNQTGIYIRKIKIPQSFSGGNQLRLRFEGVDSSFHCWFNGTYVGYSQGARNPTEFDITDWVDRDGDENTICVRVYQFCDGSYIEDQGMFMEIKAKQMCTSTIITPTNFYCRPMVVVGYFQRCLYSLIS